MTYFPNANGYRISGRPWSEEEDAVLLRDISAGKQYPEVATTLRRTIDGVKTRLRQLNRTAAERGALRVMKRRAQPKTIKMRIDHGRRQAPVVPEDVLQEMIKRLTTPRTITAVLMGDPPFPATPTNPRVLA